MIRTEDLSLEELFKEALKKKLEVKELVEFPQSLEVYPTNFPDLDKWKKQV